MKFFMLIGILQDKTPCMAPIGINILKSAGINLLKTPLQI